ncbi:hypothetical protein [Pseudoalteromonas sp. JC3]|uniref:hypothetical protein n=1 Tax=Pseudoalteromonas sp. JC3 TaxID=2810196 RepID=UPI0019D062DD|nr:hypothetical protein [Pseudoalteromonas sp. JC3]MBR8843425.1 hypothetical protein [Pseudoalteromonas sp. JC3]WJE11368.1 hypothetical protein QSH61_19795 [Pseudoalteromonas sp. JC3]
MKSSKIIGYILLVLGYVFGAISLLNVLTSMPVFWGTDAENSAYQIGFVIGLIVTNILFFALAVGLVKKGRKLVTKSI